MGQVQELEGFGLDNFNERKFNKFKAFMSTSVDRFRKPYDHDPEDYRRTCTL